MYIIVAKTHMKITCVFHIYTYIHTNTHTEVIVTLILNAVSLRNMPIGNSGRIHRGKMKRKSAKSTSREHLLRLISHGAMSVAMV